MKKYRVLFLKDFKEKDIGLYIYSFFDKNELRRMVDLCNKWRGKHISLIELESDIKDFGIVSFDGDSITLLNWDS